MSLHRPHPRKLRFTGGTVIIREYPDYEILQLLGGDWCVRSRDTGHIYAETFLTQGEARDWIGERFYGEAPPKPVLRAMAVRCRVGVAPYVFGQVYTAVSYDRGGFFDKLCVYIPNMWGTFRALPADASIFDPVNPAHATRFKHHATAGFTPLSAALASIIDRFGPNAITTGADMAGRAA